MTPEEVLALRRRVEDLRREADRNDGAAARVRAEIESEFGCRDDDEAEKLLKKLRREAGELEREAREAEEAFREKWEGELKGTS